MASFEVGGKTIPLDEEGYLENLNDWTPEVAEALAKAEAEKRLGGAYSSIVAVRKV